MVETATAGGLLVGADRHDFTAGPIASIAAIEPSRLVEPNSAPLRTNSAAYVLVEPTESSAITWSAATQVRGMVNAESNMVVMIPSPVRRAVVHRDIVRRVLLVGLLSVDATPANTPVCPPST